MRSSKALPHIIIITVIIITGFWFKSHLRGDLASRPYALPKGTSTLIIGDSHARKNLDPAQFPHALNQAQSAEFTYYSHAKLRKLLEHNRGTDQVIITVSYHSLGEFPFYESAEMNRRYRNILNGRFYREKLLREVPDPGFLGPWLSQELSLPLGVLNDLAEAQAQEAPYQGEFEPAQGSVIGKHKALREALRRHYTFHGIPTHISKLKAEYLKRIAMLCRGKGIRLIIVNTPVHPDYLRRVPKGHIRYTDTFARSLEEYGASYLNYSAMPLPDSLYYDYDHLNRVGAKVFSRILSSRLALGSRL